MPDDEIQKFVERARSGDEVAFAALYDVFAPRIYRFFLFRVSVTDAAEDLTQRVFLKMVEQLPTYESRGVPFAAWVFRVARNAWIDHDRATRPTVALEMLSQRPSEADGPEILAAASVEAHLLHEAIETLSPDEREVIACRFFAGLTPAETAAQMGRTNGSVRVLQHRALATLRQRLPPADRAAGRREAGSPR